MKEPLCQEEVADGLLVWGLQGSDRSRPGAKPMGSQGCSLHSTGAACHLATRKEEPKGLQADPRSPWALLMKSLVSISFRFSVLEQFPSLGPVGFVWSAGPFQECSVGQISGVGLCMAGQEIWCPDCWRDWDQRMGYCQKSTDSFVGFQMKCPSPQKKEVHLEKPSMIRRSENSACCGKNGLF